MGTFLGHVVPGTFFILCAIWWTVQMFNHYFQVKRRNSRFEASLTYKCACLCGRFKDWPLEAILKICFSFIACFLEIISGFRDGKLTALQIRGQHATMFFFIAMTGFADLLKYFKAPVPQDIDYAFYCLAMFIECIIFRFHLHGRDELDTMLHTLLVYTIVGWLIALTSEMRYRRNVSISLSRAYFLFLQGTWLLQIGYILYNPNPAADKWDPDDHHSLMIVTMMYAWHCGAVALIMLAIGGSVACFHRHRYDDYSVNGIAMERLINTGSNGHSFIAINDNDSDENYIECPNLAVGYNVT